MDKPGVCKTPPCRFDSGPHVQPECRGCNGGPCNALNTRPCSLDPETPGAYKDIDAVMAAQTDLVEIVHTLKQIVCVKG